MSDDTLLLDQWEKLPCDALPRFGHSVVVSGDDEFLSFFGYSPGRGYLAHLSRYNITTGVWTEMVELASPRSHMPSPRQDVMCCTVPPRENGDRTEVADHLKGMSPAVYMFGGSDESSGFNDMHRLALGDMSFASLNLPGMTPPRPAQHRCFMFHWGDSLSAAPYIFDPHNPVFLSRFLIPSAGPCSWAPRMCTQGRTVPSARDAPACAVLGSRLYVFGGVVERTGRCFNDLFVLDLLHARWEVVDIFIGLPPAPRCDAYLAPVGSSNLSVFRLSLSYLYGGRDGTGRCFGDLYRFNVAKSCWMCVVAGQPPPIPLLLSSPLRSPVSTASVASTSSPGPPPAQQQAQQPQPPLEQTQQPQRQRQPQLPRVIPPPRCQARLVVFERGRPESMRASITVVGAPDEESASPVGVSACQPPLLKWYELYLFGGHSGEDRLAFGDLYRIRVRPLPLREIHLGRLRAEAAALSAAERAALGLPPFATPPKPIVRRSSSRIAAISTASSSSSSSMLSDGTSFTPARGLGGLTPHTRSVPVPRTGRLVQDSHATPSAARSSPPKAPGASAAAAPGVNPPSLPSGGRNGADARAPSFYCTDGGSHSNGTAGIAHARTRSKASPGQPPFSERRRHAPSQVTCTDSLVSPDRQTIGGERGGSPVGPLVRTSASPLQGWRTSAVALASSAGGDSSGTIGAEGVGTNASATTNSHIGNSAGTGAAHGEGELAAAQAVVPALLAAEPIEILESSPVPNADEAIGTASAAREGGNDDYAADFDNAGEDDLGLASSPVAPAVLSAPQVASASPEPIHIFTGPTEPSTVAVLLSVAPLSQAGAVGTPGVQTATLPATVAPPVPLPSPNDTVAPPPLPPAGGVPGDAAPSGHTSDDIEHFPATAETPPLSSPIYSGPWSSDPIRPSGPSASALSPTTRPTVPTLPGPPGINSPSLAASEGKTPALLGAPPPASPSGNPPVTPVVAPPPSSSDDEDIYAW